MGDIGDGSKRCPLVPLAVSVTGRHGEHGERMSNESATGRTEVLVISENVEWGT